MINSGQIAARQQSLIDFVKKLDGLDAGERAQLKRNAGRELNEARDIHRVFFRALPYELANSKYQDDIRQSTYFLVATLFPFVPYVADGKSLGLALRQVRQFRNGSDRVNSLDRRFQTLIDSDREQLPFRLRQAVRLVAAEKLGIDWVMLLDDLLGWEREGHRTQLNWAKDYFVGKLDTEDTPSDES